MKLKTKFKCCGLIIPIRLEHIRRKHNSRGLFGYCESPPPVMVIDPGAHRTFDSLMDTVLHEALHMASNFCGVDLSENRVRKIATAQRKALTAVLDELTLTEMKSVRARGSRRLGRGKGGSRR